MSPTEILAQQHYKLAKDVLPKNIIVKSGKFGADMNISLENKGPVTIIMEQ